VFDVIMFTDKKPLRFYIIVIKEYEVNVPKQGFQASERRRYSRHVNRANMN